MSKLKIYYDKKGRTLSVWFDDPKKEVESEEVGDGTILSKDKKGKVIGFEKLYVDLPSQKGAKSPIEFAVT
ncbi:DUF2283 domain-containing protein [Candidatus Daviesbacteria bacterium]|nr:DUF2283 domain-containing protein [Candidatus Daviesbacteria bacterium]